MARIEPFRAYRYSPSAGPLADLVTQPYDKISPQMQSGYLESSPYNLVRIILGRGAATDSDSDNVYTRAAAHLRAWIGQGVLVQDAEPGFYPYFQEFELPETGDRVTRKGFIGLGPVEDYSAGIVYRHEQTLSGPKKDRLALLEATRAHFGQLFMLYADPQGQVDRALDQAAAGEPLVRVTDEYGAIHSLWQMTGSGQVAGIAALMEDKKLLIADGHHRYETALVFRRAHPELGAAGRVMMTFVNMHTAGLRILATHRVVRGRPGMEGGDLARQLEAVCRVSTLDSLEQLRKRWAAAEPGLIRIGAAVSGSPHIYLLEAPRGDGQVDVSYLHQEILGRVLGIDEAAVRDQKHLTYVRGLEKAAECAHSGGAQAAFLLEPTSVQQVADISFGGGVMPQKSTDFFPKLLSGLTIYKLD